MSGKTIDIINTDAEGRLVLADGLGYAKQLGATHLIDAATLTGAIGVALGEINAGAFSNDDATYEKFQRGACDSGEKFWRMPLGDEYADLIKSDIGDIKNTGGPLWRSHHCRGISESFRRRHAVDSSRHCGHGVD